MVRFNADNSFIFSLALHFIVLLMFIVSFEFSSTMPVLENSDKDMKVIDAVVMDSQPHSMPKPAPAQPVQQPQPAKPILQQQIQHELEVEKQQQKAIAILKRKKKLAAQKALQKQTQKEKLAKQKALEKAMEKELKEMSAKTLQQQLMQAQKQASGAKARGEVNKYKALILQAISRRWLVPSGVDKTLSCQLLIRLAPGGDVLDVQVTRSSGNSALDRSARDAVFKASPLPVPDDADAFETFRQFVLKVKPVDLVTSDGEE